MSSLNNAAFALEEGIDITADFTDSYFLMEVYDKIQKVPGSPIYDTDVAKIEKLDFTNPWKITNLSGIEHFTALKNVALEYLVLRSSYLTSLDISQNTALKYLDCSNNYNLTSLNVSKNVALEYWCSKIATFHH